MLALALFFATASVDASPCATPRQAVAQFLAHVRDEEIDLRRATRCVEAPTGMPRAERERRAQLLKAALDARAARVRLEDIPDTATYLDPSTYEAVVPLSRAMRAIYVERQDNGEWLIPAAVIARADDIYDGAVAIDLRWVKDRLPGFAHRAVFGVSLWQVLGLALLLAFGLFLGWVLTRIAASRTAAWSQVLRVADDKVVLRRTLRPLAVVVAVGVVSIGVPSLALGGAWAAGVVLALRAVAVALVLVFAYRVVDLVGDEMLRRAVLTPARMDEHVVPLVRRSLKIVVVILALVLVLQTVGVNVGSLVAGLGIGGLAVALAAKDTIGNFFGSIALYLDRPFQIGDWIIVGATDGGVEGTVENVGFRSTQIRTIRDTVISIPNAKLADDRIDNLGARRFRRIKLDIALLRATPREQVQTFVDGVRALATGDARVRKEEIEVHVQRLGDVSIDVLVHCYVDSTNWSDELKTRHDVLMGVLSLAEKQGLSLAPPATLGLSTAAGKP